MADGSRSRKGELSASMLVQARPDLLEASVGEHEAVMLDIDAGTYFGVESVAKTIWDAIGEPRPISEVVAIVAAVYETDGVELEADTLEFVQQLLDAGLVTVED